MLRQQAGNSMERRSRTNGKHLEPSSFQSVSEAQTVLQTAGLEVFTVSFIASLWSKLEEVIQSLDNLPESKFRKLVEVIDGLREVRNGLQLACYLFDVEEIPPLYRLILRNRAVLRSRQKLEKILPVWPSGAAS